MKQLVHFGAGNIGRSLVGSLFSAAGWQVVFVDADARVVQALAERGRYQVRVLDDREEASQTIDVTRVTGLDARDIEAVTRAVTEADLIATAVGARALPKVAQALAAGLARRTELVSVLLCENLRDATGLMARELAAHLPEGFPLLERVGLVETSIGKMVPLMPGEVRERDPLEVWAEPYNRIIADAAAFLTPIPEVPGLEARPQFEAWVDRKLFVHNLGHAVAAYHGHLHGRRQIWECLEDPWIRGETLAAMMVSATALAIRYPQAFTPEDLHAHAHDLLRRFGNRALGDTVHRVGRDLARKLAPDDRCVGALHLIRETGGDPEHVCRAMAAALCFHEPDENGRPFPADAAFHADLEALGLETALVQKCGLRPKEDGDIIRRIRSRYESFLPARSVPTAALADHRGPG